RGGLGRCVVLCAGVLARGAGRGRGRCCRCGAPRRAGVAARGVGGRGGRSAGA
ncbi:unnamed protein product, partial [Prorocentrum cordatum]